MPSLAKEGGKNLLIRQRTGKNLLIRQRTATNIRCVKHDFLFINCIKLYQSEQYIGEHFSLRYHLQGEGTYLGSTKCGRTSFRSIAVLTRLGKTFTYSRFLKDGLIHRKLYAECMKQNSRKHKRLLSNCYSNLFCSGQNNEYSLNNGAQNSNGFQ